MTSAQRPRLVVHIGAMKTGTTYLQNVLAANVDALGALGWYVPKQRRVVQATTEVLALPGVSIANPAADDVPPATASRRWAALVDDLREQAARPGSVGGVVSMEFLSFARQVGARRIVESLADFDVDVVITVRDAMRALPSQWNALTANGFQYTWPEFAVGVRAFMAGTKDPAGRPFRRTQDVPRMVRAWSASVERDRFTTLLVPPPAAGLPRSVLWDRFADVLGVDPARTTTEVEFDNPQLGYGSCELLVRVNAALDATPTPDYRWVLRRLTREHLLDLREGQTRPRNDRPTAVAAADLNARTLTVAGERTVVVGDRSGLPTHVADDLSLDPGDRPRLAPEAEVRDAAHAVLAGAVAIGRDLGVDPAPDGLPSLDGDLDTVVRRVAGVLAATIEARAAQRARREHERAQR
ncbi:hypothetical protein [Nocardioides litoris]|uniref:hypothetical protein n=1 Tax=Nocardioides litoris TaxID=1926648 RepID=UPI001124367B|nr:hypothetical protein [Nocardioides litoris]